MIFLSSLRFAEKISRIALDAQRLVLDNLPPAKSSSFYSVASSPAFSCRLGKRSAMQRSVITFVSFLTSLIAASCLAQMPGDPDFRPLSSTLTTDGLASHSEDLTVPHAPTSQVPSPEEEETPLTDSPKALDKLAATPIISLSEFWGYRWGTSSLDWIPGDQLGEFSFGWDHYVEEGIHQGPAMGADFHFLSGPDQTDMPARVYDFSLAYQYRDRMGPLGIDAAAAVMAASDFKGSARKGILFPAHAVGFLTVQPSVDVVMGVDYLDRGDIKLLPVAGLVLTPSPDVRYELFFPRPRAVFQLNDDYRIYFSGELGGGSWDIERVGLLGNDLATYRDLRTCVGLERAGIAFEIGYLFDRRIEYTSGIGNTNLADAVMFRLLTTY